MQDQKKIISTSWKLAATTPTVKLAGAFVGLEQHTKSCLAY